MAIIPPDIITNLTIDDTAVRHHPGANQGIYIPDELIADTGISDAAVRIYGWLVWHQSEQVEGRAGASIASLNENSGPAVELHNAGWVTVGFDDDNRPVSVRVHGFRQHVVQRVKTKSGV